MRITRLWLAGQSAWPALSINRIEPRLNVFFGQSGVGKSTAAQLAGQLLYGKAGGQPLDRSTVQAPLAEGSLELEGPQGAYMLRRHRDGTPTGRLSIASANGEAVDGGTVRTLLGGLSPRLLGQLYAVDFSRPPDPQALLEEEFSREFARAASADPDEGGGALSRQHGTAAAPYADRARIDALVRRRDAIVEQIEGQLAARRRQSGDLQRELQQIETALAERRRHREQLHDKLIAADGKLATIGARLRYFALESSARRGPEIDLEKQRDQIERLDVEIGRCRQTLADLQCREATVRRERAEAHPDGTADSASVLADQRATVSVLERLMDDLDAEIAQLARSCMPGRGLGGDSHARLSPVAQMLRQQLYALCGQVTEQQRAARRLQLHAESRQLARAQTDLSEQLEHLLARRQALIHEEQLIRRPLMSLPQAPEATYCQCSGHAEFVHDADAMMLARGDRAKLEASARDQQIEWERQRDELRRECDAADAEIERLEARWRQLQRERGEAVGTSTVDELRAELAQLEADVSRAINDRPSGQPWATAAHRRPWKASDALAQLTGGELVQIRLGGDSSATIVTREGGLLALDQLGPRQQDQLYVALTLALASSLASRGIDLPLLLDEPFLRQDSAGAAAMAGVLAEFASQGRQVIVFTENREAVRRCRSLGVVVQDLDQLRRQAGEAQVRPAAATPPSVVAGPPDAEAATSSTFRLVRETVGDRKPQLRIAGEWHSGEAEPDVYYLHEGASMADFPVLGNETAAAFTALGIATVRDLLGARATEVARRLGRPDITAEAVRLWQIHMSLMCFVPGLSLNDAQVLAANDIDSPESLFTVDARQLAGSIERFMSSGRGRRFSALRGQFSIERLAELQKRARGQRERWERARECFNWMERPIARTPAELPQAERTVRRGPAAKSAARAKRTSDKPLQFFLGLRDGVVAAPSIGPAAGQRLARVGIRTVADLLNANPESTAEEIAAPSLTASMIARWQQEARLACRVPGLRGYGARLLVAAGYVEPSQILDVQPAEFVKRMRAFCGSAEGRRLLRHGKLPSARQIARWARSAAHTRPLEAA